MTDLTTDLIEDDTTELASVLGESIGWGTRSPAEAALDFAIRISESQQSRGEFVFPVRKTTEEIVADACLFLDFLAPSDD